MVDKDWNATPIEQLDLHVRVFTYIKFAGISTVGELFELLKTGTTHERLKHIFTNERFKNNLLETLERHGLLIEERRTRIYELSEEYADNKSSSAMKPDAKPPKKNLKYIEGVGHHYISDETQD